MAHSSPTTYTLDPVTNLPILYTDAFDAISLIPAVFFTDASAVATLQQAQLSALNTNTFTNLTLDPIWKPGSVGNGRLRITGKILPDGQVEEISWRLTVSGVEGPWMSGATDLTENEVFGFWVGPLVQGVSYKLDLQDTITAGEILVDESLLSETFTWFVEVRDIVGRFQNIYMVDFMRDSELAQGLFTVHGMAWADMLAAMDDVCIQSIPQYSTWGLPIWEDELDAPKLASFPTEQRRMPIVARRSISDDQRTTFFDKIEFLLGDSVPVDHYPSYREDLRILGAADPTLRLAVEKVIDDIKPAGIQVVVNYGAFLADISEAGDSL